MDGVVSGWLSLPPEAQAAWAQAVLSVLAIGVAVAIPAFQHLRDRRERKAQELREAKSLAIMLIPNLTTWIDNISTYRRLVKSHLEAYFPGAIDWSSIQEALRLGEQGQLLAPKTHLMGDVAPDAQDFFYCLAAARQLASGRPKGAVKREEEQAILLSVDRLMERAEQSAMKARDAAHRMFAAAKS